MPQPNEKDECKCGLLARLAEHPRDPVEFDPQLNEYHIMRKGTGGYSLIYFCIGLTLYCPERRAGGRKSYEDQTDTSTGWRGIAAGGLQQLPRRTGDDEYSTGTYVGEGQPEPSASPTFRPGMNPEDPRDPHFTTRPEATQTMPPP